MRQDPRTPRDPQQGQGSNNGNRPPRTLSLTVANLSDGPPADAASWRACPVCRETVVRPSRNCGSCGSQLTFESFLTPGRIRTNNGSTDIVPARTCPVCREIALRPRQNCGSCGSQLTFESHPRPTGSPSRYGGATSNSKRIVYKNWLRRPVVVGVGVSVAVVALAGTALGLSAGSPKAESGASLLGPVEQHRDSPASAPNTEPSARTSQPLTGMLPPTTLTTPVGTPPVPSTRSEGQRAAASAQSQNQRAIAEIRLSNPAVNKVPVDANIDIPTTALPNTPTIPFNQSLNTFDTWWTSDGEYAYGLVAQEVTLLVEDIARNDPSALAQDAKNLVSAAFGSAQGVTSSQGAPAPDPMVASLWQPWLGDASGLGEATLAWHSNPSASNARQVSAELSTVVEAETSLDNAIQQAM